MVNHHRLDMKPLLLGCMLLVTACVSAPPDTAKDNVEKEPVITPKPDEPRYRKPEVTIFNNTPLSVNETDGCRNGYFRWLAWEQLHSKDDRPLVSKPSYRIGDRRLSLSWSGDDVLGRSNRLAGRIFEEDLAIQGYSYPYQGLIFFGEAIKFQSELELDFERPLDRNFVLSIGQLFRYTDHAKTEIIITAPGVSLAESVDMVQSAAAYNSRDFDAPLEVKTEGGHLRIYQDGPTGANSGFLFLRPKKGVQIKKLQFSISSSRWPEAHPDQLEIGLAQLFCGERACQRAGQVLFYDPGAEDAKHELFSKDALLALTDPNAQANTQYTSIGPGGRLELKLDGVSINRDGPELDLHFRKDRCIRANSVQIAARENTEAAWQILQRTRLQCDKVSIDLYEMPLAREIQIRNVSDSGTKPVVVDVDAVSCRQH
ncbi:MAG: hypothetical protein ACOH5I_07185 [Oligoflexus sp.]